MPIVVDGWVADKIVCSKCESPIVLVRCNGAMPDAWDYWAYYADKTCVNHSAVCVAGPVRLLGEVKSCQ